VQLRPVNLDVDSGKFMLRSVVPNEGQTVGQILGRVPPRAKAPRLQPELGSKQLHDLSVFLIC
jgi:hypothetical protein